MTVTSTGALARAFAVNSPPKPEPMMTTRGLPPDAGVGAACEGDVVMMSHSPTCAPDPAAPGAIRDTVSSATHASAAHAGKAQVDTDRRDPVPAAGGRGPRVV